MTAVCKEIAFPTTNHNLLSPAAATHTITQHNEKKIKYPTISRQVQCTFKQAIQMLALCPCGSTVCLASKSYYTVFDHQRGCRRVSISVHIPTYSYMEVYLKTSYLKVNTSTPTHTHIRRYSSALPLLLLTKNVAVMLIGRIYLHFVQLYVLHTIAFVVVIGIAAFI